MFRTVIKRRGLGIFPGYHQRGPRLLSKENGRKIERKKIPSCLIPRLLFVFAWQLEILVTTLVVDMIMKNILQILYPFCFFNSGKTKWASKCVIWKRRTFWFRSYGKLLLSTPTQLTWNFQISDCVPKRSLRMKFPC